MGPALELLGSLSEHKGCINSIKFDSTGVYCMTASSDRSVRLWNPSKRLHIKKFFGPHNYQVNDVCLAEDSKHFVSVGAEHTAFLWDTLEAKIVRKYNHGGKVGCCNFVWRNELLVTGCDDKMVRVWDGRSRSCVQTFPDALDSVSCVCERGATLSASSLDGHVRHYDLRRGVLRDDAFTHSVTGLALFSAAADCYLAAALDDSIKLVDNGALLACYRGQRYESYRIGCAFDPLERLVLSGCASGDLVAWEIRRPERMLVLAPSAHAGVVTSLAFSDPELLNAAGNLKRDVEKNVREVLLRQDNLLVSGGRDGVLKFWNLRYD